MTNALPLNRWLKLRGGLLLATSLLFLSCGASSKAHRGDAWLPAAEDAIARRIGEFHKKRGRWPKDERDLLGLSSFEVEAARVSASTGERSKIILTTRNVKLVQKWHRPEAVEYQMTIGGYTRPLVLDRNAWE